MTIGELVVKLGIRAEAGAVATLKDVGHALANMPLDAAAAIAGLAGVSFELTHLAKQAMDTAISFQLFSAETGLSWQELEKWQIVAQQANVSAESMTAGITALQRNLAAIRLGQGNLAPFNALGISAWNTDPFKVIAQLRQRLKGVEPGMAVNLIGQMGLGPEWMQILKLSDAQFEQFANHVHGLTARQEKDFLQMKLALVQWGQTFTYTMFGVISHFEEAIKKTSQFKIILEAVGVVVAGLAIYFFPLTAAMVALLLVLDDLAVYFTGGKSVTGAAVKGFKEFFKAIGEFIDETPLQKLEALVGLIERLAMALVSLAKWNGVAGAAALRAFSDTLQGGFITGPAALIARGVIGDSGDRNLNSVVHIHANSEGPLDVGGWNNVGHMLQKAVFGAYMQVNN